MASKAIFRSILFPVDFSPASEEVASHVRGWAERTGATVTLLHVIPWLSASYDLAGRCPPAASKSDLGRLEEQATLSLEIFREKYFFGIPSQREIKVGSITKGITDTAAQYGADLIMMPTRGLGRSRPFLIGSTTAKVLHDARCAVWTSPHRGILKPFTAYQHILCALDREEVPRGYLEEATHLSSCFDSRLSFVTAIPSLTGGYGEERQIESLGREFPQAHLRQAATPDHCTVLTETGAVGDVIRQVAENHHVDLVLINRGHLQQPYGKFQTHVYDIVLESPCPVLSLCISYPLAQQERVKNHASAASRFETAVP